MQPQYFVSWSLHKKYTYMYMCMYKCISWLSSYMYILLFSFLGSVYPDFKLVALLLQAGMCLISRYYVLLSEKCVRIFVCLPPEAITYYTHVKWSCVNQLNSCCNFPVSSVIIDIIDGMVLVTKCIITAFQRRQRSSCIALCRCTFQNGNILKLKYSQQGGVLQL